ncbi:MarR family winged helix-turn-helix transcriptional regulator [Nocardia inohanensis]|uniref:MarR family winged helix-turn-helix transcriptional regulator n=1 Tax=Nocardia inohanensis TaxID=209246 RepID=UPI0009FF62C6|nr:MarR family transcriptional regulator [Nocardia inohanensis]
MSGPAEHRSSAQHSPEDLTVAAAELRIISSRLLRHLRTARAGLDITPSQAVALSRLGSDGPSTVADLARAERVRPQSMRLTVAALEDRGYLTRAPHPTDQRQNLLSLTPEGERLLNQAHDAKEDWLAESIATKLSPTEQHSLLAAIPLLARLVEP